MDSITDDLLSGTGSTLNVRSPSELFHSVINLGVNCNVNRNVRTSRNSIMGDITNLTSTITTRTGTGRCDLNNVISAPRMSNTLANFSSGITDDFDGLLRHLRTVTSNMAFAAPTITLNNSIPCDMSTRATNPSGITKTVRTSGSRLNSIMVRTIAGTAATVMTTVRTGDNAIMGLSTGDVTADAVGRVGEHAHTVNESPLAAAWKEEFASRASVWS